MWKYIRFLRDPKLTVYRVHRIEEYGIMPDQYRVWFYDLNGELKRVEGSADKWFQLSNQEDSFPAFHRELELSPFIPPERWVQSSLPRS